MKKIDYCISKVGLFRFFGILFLIGVFFGSVFANMFRTSFLIELSDFQLYFKSNLNVINVDNEVLLKIIIFNNYKSFFLLIFICLTAFGIPYVILFVLYQGFKFGFLLSAAVMQYRLKGILLFFTFLFPQHLIYTPVLLIGLIKGFYLCKKLHYNLPQYRADKRKVIPDSLLTFLLLGIGLLFGSFLEAYVNVPILKKVMLNWF